MICMSAEGAFFHWRTISWISISFCILPLLLISLWSPESPAWLVSRGKSEQALKSLLILYQKENIAEQQLEKLIKELNKKQRQEYQSSSAFWTLIQGLTKPTGYKPALLLIVIFILQQFSGITVTIYYSVSFFQSVGTSVDPFLSSVGVGVVRLITTVVTSVLLRHFGRRPLFIYSSIGMAISIFIAGYLTKEIQNESDFHHQVLESLNAYSGSIFKLDASFVERYTITDKDFEENVEKNSLPILFILMYVSLGSIGFNTIPWIISAELFPIEIRGMAQSLIMGIAFFNVFSIVKIYPFMDEALGGSFRVQWMFSIVSLIGALFIFIFLPETHKKELIEIEEYFKNNSVYPLRHKRQTRELAEEAALEMIKQ
ncbi:hypothetical protein J6590_013479 [Homalodisca vitripennis]|nr:hypothetical protein J6590_013479 [Homalodisca vitripennis]